MRTVFYVIGTALFVVGLAVLLGVGGIYALSEVDRLKLEQQLAATPLLTPTATATATDTATPSPTPASSAEPAAATPLPPATPTPMPTSTPTPTPEPRPPQRIVAPTIKLDSRIVESPIRNGYWDVPKFVAGHLELTANPNSGGNIVLAGHVESISSGNVFANIGSFEVGDEVSIFTDREEIRYRVNEIRIVKNDDISVVQPTPVETLTLITCYGTFLPATRDYDRRLIVTARRDVEAPTPRPPAVREPERQ